MSQAWSAHRDALTCPNKRCEIELIPPGVRRCPKCNARPVEIADNLYPMGIPKKSMVRK